MASNGKGSLSTLSAWAKELLRGGETVRAEDYFSRAIARIEASTTELPPTWLMEMLEGRAAARQQNGKLEEALTDGNRMLKVEKSNPRGYICLGRLLETKKKLKSALKCYAYGLTQCAQSHESFLDLVKAHRTLARLISETERVKTARDPICTFPHEILMMVFKHLPFREIIKCHRVSLKWKNFLSSESSLYRSIDLVSLRNPLSSLAIKRLIQLSSTGIGIRSMAMNKPQDTFGGYHVPGYPECKSQTLSLLRQLFKNLEIIHILRAPERRIPFGVDSSTDLNHEIDILPLSNLVHINIEFPISPRSFVGLCGGTPHLEFLGCHLSSNEVDPKSPRTYPLLKSLSLSVPLVNCSHWAEVCSRWFPNLEALTIVHEYGAFTNPPLTPYDWEFYLNNLRKLRLGSTNRKLSNLRLISKEIQILELAELTHLQEIRLPVQSHLEELHISSVPLLQKHILTQFYESAKSLQHLTLSSPQFTPKDFDHFLGEGTNLRSIKVNSSYEITDSTLTILHSHHRLERLEIDDCREVTGNGIINLVKSLSIKNGGKLRSISVRENPSIRRQTIDWARDQGVIISI